MEFVVTLETSSGTHYLRGTVWTFAGAFDRATIFASKELAQAALNKAKPFMKAAQFKAAKIEEA